MEGGQGGAHAAAMGVCIRIADHLLRRMTAGREGCSTWTMTAAAPLSLTWVGHATALIELDGTRLLTDPLLRSRLGPLVRVARAAGIAQRIDVVCLSHLHMDHADAVSLRRVAAAALVVAPRGSAGWLRNRGVVNVRELSPGEETRCGELRIIATPAVHDARRGPFGVHAAPVGYVVAGSQSVYFAGDTDVFAGMADLAGSIDLALLPVAGWGPTLGPGHLDPERAAAAAALISPRLAIPIHWGTYALAGWAARRVQDAPARRFAALVARHAPRVEVRVLAPGERTELAPARRTA